MKPAPWWVRATTVLAGLTSFALPSLALACPYASADGTCGSCGASSASLLSYGACLVLGLGLGIASVAFERDRR
jgi:hypothetical protein